MSDFAKRIGLCLKKPGPYAVGAGICGTAAITAYVMSWRNNSTVYINKESEDNTDNTKGNIFDLEEIGKKKAWAMYKHDQESKKSVHRKLEKPVLQLNWDGVKSFPEKPCYKISTIVPKKEDTIRVIFQAVFQNKSNEDQQQTLRAGVETLSTSDNTLTKGYTKGSEVGLSLQAPDEIVNAGFTEGFFLKHVNGNLEVKPIPWVINELIKVPKNSKIEVTKTVFERHKEFDFEAMVGFEGDVQGNFNYQNTKNNVSYQIPISTIINELPREMISEINGIYRIKINGRCAFKYNIEQKNINI